MQKNITLVYPSIKNGEAWNSLGSSFDGMFINHGLASLTACLKQKGFTVRLLDLRELSGWSDVEKWVLKDASWDYGIYMATLDFTEAVAVASLIRKIKPTAHIYVGGPHPSICPEQVLEQNVFDGVLQGEGEITFPDLLEHPQDYSRLIKCERPNLDLLPYEDRSIFNLSKVFAGKAFFPKPFVNVISGRGCVFRCGFCKPGEDLIFGKFRMRGLSHFLGEIELLNQAYDFKTLMIDDDSFTLYPDYVKRFCAEYKVKVAKPFICQSRADMICRSQDLIKTMKDAGLFTLFIGFESGSQRMLDFMRKDTTVKQNLEAAEVCRKLDIKIWANFMIGLPTETKEEMKATLNMIRKIKPLHPSGAFFTPIVGTELYDYCRKHDLMVSYDPAVLGSRNPSVPKIKGLDYVWMNREMQHLTAPKWKRVARPVRRVAKHILSMVNPKRFEVSM